jgi:membrane dipeptidase
MDVSLRGPYHTPQSPSAGLNRRGYSVDWAIMPFYIDGHLDLAYNALAVGRDLTLDLDALRQTHPDALVTLPELQRAGVKVAFGTIFVLPADASGTAPLPGRTYTTPDEARTLGLAQLEFYERLEEAGHVRILRTQGDLEAHLQTAHDEPHPLGIVLLLEGADPLRTPDELSTWAARGLRLVGPAWQRTRYAGGTHHPGPLSELGRELIHALRELGLVLDASHLAEESFWEALELGAQRVVASHSNARALVPTDRHLSDAMIRALAERDGVVGLVIANPFLNPHTRRGGPKQATTLQHVRRHAEHVAWLIGWERLAIGSDFDGGFGLGDIPAELERAADFAMLGDAVPEAARGGFLGENWLRLLRRVLPE